MKKKILISLIIVPFALVLFFGINNGSSCACVTRDDEVQMLKGSIRDARKIIEKEREKNGAYPTYEELEKNEELKDLWYRVSRYDGKRISSEGLFYALSSDGNSYTLKGYMAVSFFDAQLPLALEVKD